MKFLFAIFLFAGLNACTSNQKKTETPGSATTITEKNKELVKRVYAEMANKQNYALIDSFFAPDIFDHGAFEGQEQGLEGFKKAVTEFLGMFSKVEIQVENMIAEEDFVSTVETWKVIRKSDSKELTGQTIHWFRIKDDRITDEWSKGWEWLGL
jgi:predicted SnoaL-like aldol condensation-catalyzing enzyme